VRSCPFHPQQLLSRFPPLAIVFCNLAWGGRALVSVLIKKRDREQKHSMSHFSDAAVIKITAIASVSHFEVVLWSFLVGQWSVLWIRIVMEE
jgi:hypothetical protein